MPEQTRPARGMRDFLPEDVRRRDYVIGVVEDVYRRYGFEPLETPALENIETLTGKYGDEGAKLIFKVLRRGEHEASGETDLALRYDLTVPLARVVAEHRGQAAALLQALPDSAGVARGPSGPGPVPRVLSVRRRRHRVALAGGRSGGVRGGERCARPAGVQRLRDSAQSPRPAARHARELRRSHGAARSGARGGRQARQDRTRRGGGGAVDARHRGGVDRAAADRVCGAHRGRRRRPCVGEPAPARAGRGVRGGTRGRRSGGRESAPDGGG